MFLIDDITTGEPIRGLFIDHIGADAPDLMTPVALAVSALSIAAELRQLSAPRRTTPQR